MSTAFDDMYANIDDEKKQRELVGNLFKSLQGGDLNFHISSEDCKMKVKYCELSKLNKQECIDTFPTWRYEYNQFSTSETYEDFKMKCRLSNVLKHNLTGVLRESVNTTNIEMQSVIKLLNLVFYFGTIAGGFLLKMLNKLKLFDNTQMVQVAQSHSFMRSDIDVFMTRSDFKNFMSRFRTLPYIKFMIELKFIYSGMANNNQNIYFHIKIMLTFPSRHQFDIVVVDNVDTAIRNFDLTFCMLSATMRDKSEQKLENIETLGPLFEMNDLTFDFVHPKHIMNRSGKLQGMFIQEFLNGNATTRNRIHKYLGYGFAIQIPTPDASITLAPHNYNTLLKNRETSLQGIKAVRIICYNLMYHSNYLDSTSRQSWFDLFLQYSETLGFFQQLKDFFNQNQQWQQRDIYNEVRERVNLSLTQADFPAVV